MIPDHHISRLKRFDKIRILSLLNLPDPLTNQAHLLFLPSIDPAKVLTSIGNPIFLTAFRHKAGYLLDLVDGVSHRNR